MILLAFFVSTSSQAVELSQDSIKIIAVSDINSSLGSTTYRSSVSNGLQSALDQKPDLVIGVGDYVAGEDVSHKYPLSLFEEMWRSFKLNILEKILLSQVEFAPSPGNHDASGYSRLQRERDLYVDFWNRHRPRLEYVDDRFYPYYFSYLVNDVFFISMDDVTPFRLLHGDEQRLWINNQLSSSVAQSARARIVYGHIPLYPILDKAKHSKGSRGKYYEVLSKEQLEQNQQGLEKIFLDNSVSLAVFAHSHSFFPGKVIHQKDTETQQLRILSMPCLGPGARYLSEQKQRSQYGYAMIEISANGNIDVNGYDYSGGLIKKSSLPERIIVPGKYNRYYRDDISPAFK